MLQYKLVGTSTWLDGPSKMTVNGIASDVCFTQTKAGTYDVRGWVASKESTYVTGSARQVTFVAGDVDLSKSTFVVSRDPVLALGDASNFHTATVHLVDTYGNGVKSQGVTFTVAQGSATVPGPWFEADKAAATIDVTTCEAATSTAAWCTEDGFVQVQIRSEEPGTFPVGATMTVGGAQIPANDTNVRQVSFTAGDVDPSKSRWTVTPDPTAASTKVVAGTSDTYAISIEVRSLYGILKDGASVRLDLSDPAVDGIVTANESMPQVTGTPTIDQWGVFTFHVKATTPGTYTFPVQVQLSNGSWANIEQIAPLATLEFVAGQGSAKNSVLSITTTGNKAADGTEFHTAQVLVKDDMNNLVDGQDVFFTFNPVGASPSYCTAVSNAAGVATCDFTSTVAGTVTVHGYLGSAAAALNEVTDSPKTAEFVAGPVDWAKTLNSLETKSAASAADGWDLGWARVTVQDSKGNTISGVPNVCFNLMYAHPTPPANPAGPRWDDGNSAGVNAPGLYGAVPSICGTSGTNGVVEVNAASIYPSTGDGFAVRASNGTAPGAQMTDVQHQKYLKYTLNVVDPTKSYFTVEQTDPATGDAVANGSDYYTVKAYLNDAAGHPVNGGGASISLSPAVAAGQPVISGGTGLTAGTDGTATKTITSTLKGTWTVKVLVGGEALGLNAPVPVQTPPAVTSGSIAFVAGPACATNSKLTDAGIASFANGTDTQKITAEVRDCFGLNSTGNLVSGQDVVFTIPANVTAKGTGPGGSDQPGPASVTVPTGSTGLLDGIAELNLVSTRAGNYDVTATINAAPIWRDGVNGAPAVARFKAGGPDQSTFEVTTTGGKEAGVESHCADIEVLDASGNLVDDAAAPIRTYLEYRLAGSSDPWQVGAWKDTSGGQASNVCFTRQKAGTYDVRGMVANVESLYVTGSAKQVTFVAGQVDYTKSTFEVSDNSVLATGLPAHFHTATVKLVDQFGNGVTGEAVQLVVDPGLLTIPGPWFGSIESAASVDGVTCDASAATAPAWCTEDGLFIAEIRSKVPGTFDVTATSGANKIPDPNNTRQVAFQSGPPSLANSKWTVSPDPTDPATKVVAGAGGGTYAITLEIRSAANILVPHASVRLDLSGLPELSTTTANPNQTGTPLRDAWGMYTFYVKSTSPGTFSFPVQVMEETGDWGTIETMAPMATLKFTSGPAAGPMSWLVEPGVSQEVGTDQVVEARVYDANGFPVEDGTEVAFTVPQDVTARGVGGAADTTGGPGVVVTRTTVGGIATLTVVSQTAAQGGADDAFVVRGRITASDESIATIRQASAPTVTGPVLRTNAEAHVWWRSGVASKTKSVLSITTTGTKVANGVQVHTAQILVRDDSDNPVGGQDVFFTFNPVGLADSTCSATSNPSGIATCDFASTVAGTVTVHGYLGGTAAGDEVAQSPKTAVFVAGPVDPQKTVDSLTTESGAARANGTQSRWAKVTVQDQYGNPIDGQPVCFHLLWAEATSGLANGPLWDNALNGPAIKCHTSTGDGTATVLGYSYYASPASDLDGYDVKARFDVGSTSYYSAEAKKIAYTNDAPVAEKSWWTVAKTGSNPDPGKVQANGTDSYTVTVNLRNIETGSVYMG
ncbi:MAG: Ig-like domain-containing protein, partial [Micrococcales bacterium]|nr:Ig-like domain-containing protein [Micrococcales bacterium]